jgi:LmbE family N-acetylglucosaminyl deacetylase
MKPKNNTEDFLINKIETSYLNGHQAIFVPTYIDAHFEHRLTNRLAAALTRCRNISIIEYRTPSTLNDWSPNMYIDITNVYEQKLSMLSEFSSQQNKEYFKRTILNAFHTDFQSSKKGNVYVEQFKLIQLYGI